MSEYKGGFCVALCGDEMVVIINNRDKISINRNHQVFIDSRKYSLEFLGPENNSVIIISEDIIGEFISSVKCSPESLMYNLKSNEDAFQVECHDRNIFNLAIKYASILNPTEEERYCSRALIFIVLSFFTRNKAFLPRLIHSINNPVTYKVQAVIARNVGHDWTLSAVAHILYMSPSSLKRHMKLEGTSYNKILVQCRMQHAAKILSINHDITINQLAPQCGYSHLSYFIYAFRKYYGLTPCQFVKHGLHSASECIRGLKPNRTKTYAKYVF